MNSIESNNETQSRERLFAATVKYVQSPGKACNEEKSAKVLLVLGMAVRGIYMDVRSKLTCPVNQSEYSYVRTAY